MLLNYKKMRIVRQKTLDDCAVCSLTMLTGLRYRQVKSKIGDCYVAGEGLYDVDTSLRRLGFKQGCFVYKTVSGYPIEIYKDLDFKRMRKPSEISSEYFKECLWGRRALVTVPSLNFPSKYHMLYWHIDKVLDPSNLKTYNTIEELKPTEIYLFRERI